MWCESVHEKSTSQRPLLVPCVVYMSGRFSHIQSTQPSHVLKKEDLSLCDNTHIQAICIWIVCLVHIYSVYEIRAALNF